jgi:cyclophilin family peptidyl-prolyl cis-trans isomerase
MVKKATCPICGASMRKTNLKQHMIREHPGGGEAMSRGPSFIRTHIIHLILVAVAIVVVIGVVSMAEKKAVAVVETTLGTFEVLLDTEHAPVTAGNFINLSENGFYNGLTFHRVAKDFVIQGGDPLGTGQGGSGRDLPWEATGLKNEKYTIAMARAGDPDSSEYKNTGSSQFFINLDDNDSLDDYAYPFAVFGRVIEGFNVVDQIGALYPASMDGAPTQKVQMNISIKYRWDLG